ncbi:hypothetical protein ASPZODRAFT_15525 [Penicilliopsis zonata CBS 506.65]|uniref:Uncharacterized protein n=1 Tax=Penicilliopsis zonata CBS 506.65 TaxID=1073090 RepID=A0A1L9SHZ2_9EURO|nr:hypothetical protein ASPZODRAFT_15525 [Penicilliopsis zonata CBS 506.65]OJJ46832.1 hypothetical protein ASPZODRAFT_15525 [Penicilliopsis zonata CBS 506.65]
MSKYKPLPSEQDEALLPLPPPPPRWPRKPSPSTLVISILFVSLVLATGLTTIILSLGLHKKMYQHRYLFSSSLDLDVPARESLLSCGNSLAEAEVGCTQPTTSPRTANI